MNKFKNVQKYETALKIILFCVEANPNVNLTQMRKELKLNKNFITALIKLGIIKNNGNRGASNYILVKKFTDEMTLEVLNFSNELSTNKKPVPTVQEPKQEPVKELNFFQKLIKILFNGTI